MKCEGVRRTTIEDVAEIVDDLKENNIHATRVSLFTQYVCTSLCTFSSRSGGWQLLPTWLT